MASLTPNILPFASLATSMQDPHTQILAAGISVLILVGIIFAYTFKSSQNGNQNNTSGEKQGDAIAAPAHEPRAWESLLRFVYACFLKPHAKGDGQGQQAALESFYRAQADVYDATRRTLLRGREDMLGLAAAQLVRKAALERGHGERRVWVDVSHATMVWKKGC
jgi:betaine lipid synthase